MISANMANALCRSLDMEANTDRTERNNMGDDALCMTPPFSSTFTAINRLPTQLLTPQSSLTSPIQQNQARRRVTKPRKRRNPGVAQYLGIGSPSEPIHLQKYAPLSSIPETPLLKPIRRRRKLGGVENILNYLKLDKEGVDTPNRKPDIETFCAKKLIRPCVIVQSTASKVTSSPDSHICVPDSQVPSSNGNISASSNQTRPQYIAHDKVVKNDDPESVHRVGQSTEITPEFPCQECSSLETNENNIYKPAQLCFQSPQNKFESLALEDDDFDGDISDIDLLMLMPANYVSTSPPESRVLPDLHGPINDSEEAPIEQIPDTVERDRMDNNSQYPLKKFVSPVHVTTRMLVPENDVNSEKCRKPITRPPFPAPVHDDSPIVGLTSKTLLRTCFRIGEAINQSCQALKSGDSFIIELYARVLESRRTGESQHFTFCDLFHARPPYIEAVYDAAIWKPVQLFEYDSRRLLQAGRVCRCMGTMKRKEKEWTMTVLNIWEATWDDIRWVEGIVSF